MSEMQFAYGVFEESNLDITPRDDDDFYDLEEEHKCHFVKVAGKLYSFYLIGDHDAYGFGFVVEPSEENRFCALWYNGGAGIHEVVEEIIKKHVGAK